MKPRPLLWFAISLLCLVGAYYFWQLGEEWRTQRPAAPVPVAATNTSAAAVIPASTAPFALLSPAVAVRPSTTPEDRLQHRLNNTGKSPGQLLRDDRAILLENALVDTKLPVALNIPDHLRAGEEPGAYIVQACGPVDHSFRAALARAGATIVSYIPNNAYLVRVSASQARQLSAAACAVLPYEPYYKLKAPLLAAAVKQAPLPDGAPLNLLLFADAAAATTEEVRQQGAEVLAEERTPFGPVVRVRPAADSLPALAALPGVQAIELAHPRVAANDLSRVRVGVAVDTRTNENHLGLTGANVLVNVNDSGVDAAHPDLTGRVFGDAAATLVDDNGHGTHVAGIIASSGGQSPTVTNASGSINPGIDGQYRGLAPAARIFALPINLGNRPGNDLGAVVSDTYLQETPARTNALISNNSWHYGGDSGYGITAASYDAAVRDALPGVPGSQPILFVFAAGNSGNGDDNDNGESGNADSIQAPGTAKNVITVGAIEQLRNITNEVLIKCAVTNINGTNVTVCTTNQPWLGPTDSTTKVAAFSSRGNVGIGIEGDAGRFKPDVVAPGTFVVSTRSTTWNPGAYYNPTNHHVNRSAQLAVTNFVIPYQILIPANAVQLVIRAVPNPNSPVPFPDVPIFVRQADIPTATTYDLLGTNIVSLPPDLPLNPVGAIWSYGIGNSTTQNFSYDLVTDVLTTNDLGNYFEVLSNLNNMLGPYYRYESGTSMSAAEASGALALIQEQFEQRLGRTNSPALMKALLINGGRSLDGDYDFDTRRGKNLQGWGLLKLQNSLPPAVSNLNSANPSSLLVFDQGPELALATAQSHTRRFTIQNPLACNLPLRFTLAWTDPPGNPVAGVKLVNDLDLVVTNLDTGEVFLGNDITAGRTDNAAWDTNSPASVDLVNNVENVYLSPLLGSNYSVTVTARRVNVNAVTAHTNDVVQDYALVITSGDGQLTDALALAADEGIVLAGFTNIFQPTNTFDPASTPGFSGTLLFNQRVGANTPLLGTTNGMTNQWHFYVLTNDTTFTNAAFITFLPPTLSLPRIGVRAYELENSTREEADIDLYVTTDPGLLTLDPAAIAGADKSCGRGGTETIASSNAVPGAVYYIGVKSEDQMAAEYAFIGVFSELPFSERDPEGNLIVRGFPLPSAIPDGSPADPGIGLVFGLAIEPVTIRRVIVTNTIAHENLGDLVGHLTHGRQSAVLNNHRGEPDVSPLPGYYSFIYEDNGEANITPPAGWVLRNTDGPGDLRSFIGEEGIGLWLLAMVDNSLTQTGAVTDLPGLRGSGFTLKLEPQNLDEDGEVRTLPPDSWTYDFIEVPVSATNLTVSVAFIPPSTGPVELYVRKGGFPTATVYDHALLPIVSPGGSLSINRYDLPPLSVGRWYIGVYNPTAVDQTIRLSARLDLDVGGVLPLNFAPDGPQPLLDDAVTNFSIFLTNNAKIATAEVGLRVDHPRVSDLAFTLIAPDGTRVLLMENRGRTNDAGIGSSTYLTNVVPVSASGGPATTSTNIDTGATSGSLTIDYEFFTLPDQMTVYYEGNLIYDTGMTGGAGRFTVNYGPGASTLVTIVMNEFGNTNATTAWEYTVGNVQDIHQYLIFTENTNLTTTPIKFATPPFLPQTSAGGNLLISGFDAAAVGNYVSPAFVDDWTVSAFQVSVVDDPVIALSGQYLALANGTISRTLPTTPGQNYRLDFAYRSTPTLDGIISWWPGEGAANDIVDGNHGTLADNATYGAGKVGQGFVFDGVTDRVPVGNAPNLQMQDFTIEAWVKRADTTRVSFGSFGNGIIFSFGQLGYGLYLDLNGYPALSRIGIDETKPSMAITDLEFHHLAVTKSGASVIFYIDGVAYGAPNYNPGFVFNTVAAIGARGDNLDNSFLGTIDEPAVYNRVLAPSEIQAIHAAGAAGKCGLSQPPAVCSGLGAQVFVPGVVTNTFIGTTNWQTNSLTFTATASGTPIGLAPVSGQSGMLLDVFTLSETVPGGLYYLPEESLRALAGKDVFGEWKLEIWDSRTGATNQTSLVSWQLSFVFENPTPLPAPLTDGDAYTNTIPAGQIAYFIVDVPPWANFATNSLLTATGPLNLLFNQNFPPAIGAANPGDFLLFGPVTSGSTTLSTTTVPPLVANQRYYLGLHNPNPGTVTYALRVDFDGTNALNIVTLTNAIPYAGANAGGGSALDYYRFVVSSNAVQAQFEILLATAPMTLVARRGLPLPNLTFYDYLSQNPGLADELILVFTNSSPVALTPGDWYLTAANVSGGPVSYSIKATESSLPPDGFIWAGVSNVNQFWSTPGNWIGNAAPPPLGTNVVWFRGDVPAPYNHPLIQGDYLGATTLIFSNNLSPNGVRILGGTNNTMNLGPFVRQDSPQPCHFGMDVPVQVGVVWVTNYNFTNALGDASFGSQTDFQCAGGDLSVYGVLKDGAGTASALVKSGNGTLILTGQFPNAYTGGTVVNAGRITLQKPPGFAALPGDVTVHGTASLLANTVGGEQIADAAIVTLNNSTVFDLAGQPETVQTVQSLSAAASLLNVNGVLAVAPQAGQTYNSGAGTGESVFAGNISGNLSGPGTVVMNGTGTYGMLGANAVANLTINSGTLKLNGNSGTGAVNVNSGGTLLVNGTVAGTLNVAPGGTVQAGFSPGKLILGGGLNMIGATNVWELAALTDAPGAAGTAYDQIVLTGGALVLSGATLDIRFIDAASSPDAGHPFWQSPRSWTVIALNGGFNPADTRFDVIENGSFMAGEFSVSATAAGIVLRYTPSLDSTNNYIWDGDAEPPPRTNGIWNDPVNWGILNNRHFNQTPTISNFVTFRRNFSPGGKVKLTDDGFAKGIRQQFSRNFRTIMVEESQTVDRTLTLGGDGVALLDCANAGVDIWFDGAPNTNGARLKLRIEGLGLPMGTALNKAVTLTMGCDISGAGGFVLNGGEDGAGRLILNGQNTYTGPTVINAGFLLVNGDTTGSAFTVNGGGILGGDGTIGGPVTVSPGGEVSPGNSIGTLTVNGDFTLAGDLLIEVNKSQSPSNDLISVSGACQNIGEGSLQVLTYGAVLEAGDTFRIFNQPLVNGDAVRVLSAGREVWTNKLAVDGTIAVLYATNTPITGDPTTVFTWAGRLVTDPPWKVPMQVPTNWLENAAPPPGSSNVMIFQGDILVPWNWPFVDAHYGTTILLFSNNIVLNSIKVLAGSNTTVNLGSYARQDTAQPCYFGITGPVPIIWAGSPLYMVTNAFHTNALGGAACNSQTEFQCVGGRLDMYGVLQDGPGASSRLVKSGNFTLNITGDLLLGDDANTYTGGTIVNAGAIKLQKMPGTNAIPGDVTVNGRGSLVMNIVGGEQIADSAIVTLNHSGQLSLLGQPETVQTVQGPDAGASVLLGNGGTLTVAPLAAATYNGGLGISDFAGSISGNGTVRMNGTGIYGMLGANSVASLVVNSGTLKVNGNSGTGPVTVQPGAALWGRGAIAGPVQVDAAGTISAGFSAGALTLPAGLNLNGGGNGATNVWDLAALKDDATGVAGTDFDQIIITGGTLALGAQTTLDLRFTGAATDPDAGDPFWQSPRSWTIIALAGGANPGDANFATIRNGSFAAGTFATSVSGGSIVLTFTPGAVPPPTGLRITRLEGAGTGAVTVYYTNTIPGTNYFLTYCTNLNTTNWFAVGSKVAAGTGDFQTDNTAGGPQRYYRVYYGAASGTTPSPGDIIPVTDIFVATNHFCVTWASVPGQNYYVQGLTNLNSTNWVVISPTITATGSLTTWCVALPSPYSFFRVVAGTSPADLAAPPVITSAFVASNSFCLGWTSVSGQNYHVQGRTNLNSTNWVTVSTTITATGNLTTWCLALPSPFHFFRVVAGAAGSPAISRITASPAGMLMEWTASPGARFHAEWSPTLAPPAWTPFTNVITSATDQFSFLDDGAQTGGLGSLRFYRLVQLP